VNANGRVGKKRRQRWKRQRFPEVQRGRREVVRWRGTRLGLGRVAPFRGLRAIGRKESFWRCVL
jgi:hypothetical protein